MGNSLLAQHCTSSNYIDLPMGFLKTCQAQRSLSYFSGAGNLCQDFACRGLHRSPDEEVQQHKERRQQELQPYWEISVQGQPPSPNISQACRPFQGVQQGQLTLMTSRHTIGSASSWGRSRRDSRAVCAAERHAYEQFGPHAWPQQYW